MAEEQQVDLGQEQDNDTELVKQLRAEIRARNDVIREAESRAQLSEKRATFQTLGIDPTKGVGKLFYEAYSGDLNEEAIAEAAKSYELPVGPHVQPAQPVEPPQEQPPTNSEEREAHSAMNNAAAGANAADSEIDPTKAGWEQYEQTFQSTGNREAAMASHFGAKLQAAVEAQKKQRG